MEELFEDAQQAAPPPPEPEIVEPEEEPEEEQAQDGAVVIESGLMSLAEEGVDGIARFERAVEILTRARAAAIKLTRAQDWVLTQDASGATKAYLAGTGKGQLTQLFGIDYEVSPTDSGRFRPEKITDDHPKGVYTLRCWCEARSHLTGRRVRVEASRRSDEDFTGRQTNDAGKMVRRDGTRALESDLRLAVHTLAVTKAIRELTGLAGVTADELQEAGIDLDHCRQGQGFGSSSQRSAGRVAEKGVKEEAAKLAKEVLSRVSGNQPDAEELMVEITHSLGEDGKPDGKFAGFSSGKSFTKDWQVRNAWARLRAHPVHGDGAANGS